MLTVVKYEHMKHIANVINTFLEQSHFNYVDAYLRGCEFFLRVFSYFYLSGWVVTKIFLYFSVAVNPPECASYLKKKKLKYIIVIIHEFYAYYYYVFFF